jgi:hypothetical protein
MFKHQTRKQKQTTAQTKKKMICFFCAELYTEEEEKKNELFVARDHFHQLLRRKTYANLFFISTKRKTKYLI